VRRYYERVQLPPFVTRLAEEHAEDIGFSTLKQASAVLSQAYRERRAVHLPDRERVAAYLVTRMPATYAAAYSVLRELQQRLDGIAIKSVLDIGSGTGAASLAVRAWFPDAAITMVETDAAFAAVARQLIPDATFASMHLPRPLPPHDLVIAAYSLGEIRQAIARPLWHAAKVALVAIEPGTPQGFALIRGIRTELLGEGAHMAAPCPGAMPCPIIDPDWCHFAARVERSSLHRRVKEGALGHEDEKYSYLAVTREPVVLPAARIVRHPQQRPGLIVLETCTIEGLESVRVTKRDRDAFREARKSDWGSEWGKVS